MCVSVSRRFMHCRGRRRVVAQVPKDVQQRFKVLTVLIFVSVALAHILAPVLGQYGLHRALVLMNVLGTRGACVGTNSLRS